MSTVKLTFKSSPRQFVEQMSLSGQIIVASVPREAIGNFRPCFRRLLSQSIMATFNDLPAELRRKILLEATLEVVVNLSQVRPIHISGYQTLNRVPDGVILASACFV